MLALALSAAGQGRIVACHDEWVGSNSGFAQAPAGATAIYFQNVASWFADGGTGNFFVASGNFGLTESSLAAAMTGAGHTWTLANGSNVPLTAAGFAAFDGVFVAGGFGATLPAELVAYVQAGGRVYVAGGSGGFGNSGNEAAYWNAFLNVFGMAMTAPYNGVGGVDTVPFAHPIFAGVAGLYYSNGNSVQPTSGGGTSFFGPVGATTAFRFGIYDGATPLYQTNRPEATLTIDGLAGTAFTLAPPGGANGVIGLSSTLIGAPWDFAVTVPDPIVAVGVGGFALSDGQIVNLALNSPGFLFAFGGFGGGGFPGPVNIPYSALPGSLPLSVQMVVLDPAAPLGLHLSAPIRIQP